MALSDFVKWTRTDVRPQPSPPSFKVNNFDLVRLFAAVQVAIFHCYERFEIPIPAFMVPLGWFPGVPIFFVLSGYLISSSFERSSRLSSYAGKRALRIFPGLWGLLFATLIAAGAFGLLEWSYRPALWFVTQMVGLIYTPAFLKGFGDGTYNGSLWTIPIELQFYASLPVLYFIANRLGINNRRFFIVVFLLALAAGAAVKLMFPQIASAQETPAIKLLRYTFIPRFYMFLFGVLLYKLQVHASPLIRGRGFHWLAAYMLFHLVVPDTGLYYMVAELFLAIVAISLAYTVPTVSERLLRGTDISYGTYLYHGLIVNIVIELAIPDHRMLITLAASLFAAFLSWTWIERPALRFKLRRATPDRATITPATAEN